MGKDESREFMAVFPDIVRDLTEAGKHLDIPDVTKWYAKVRAFKSYIEFQAINSIGVIWKIAAFLNTSIHCLGTAVQRARW